MWRKTIAVIERDDYGFYAWCPMPRGCQSQGATLDEAMANTLEAVELYLERVSADELEELFSKETLTTSSKVNA